MCQIVNAEAVTQQELCDPKRVEVILNAYAAGVAEYAPLGADGRRVLEGFLVRQMSTGGPLFDRDTSIEADGLCPGPKWGLLSRQLHNHCVSTLR